MSRKRAREILERMKLTPEELTHTKLAMEDPNTDYTAFTEELIEDRVELLAEELDNAAQRWGAGPASEWHFLERQRFDDGKEFRVFMGEHPHSRNDNNFYALVDGEGPFRFSGHHVRTSVEVTEFNYLKSSSLTGDEIRSGCHVDIKLDDRLVYRHFACSAQNGLIWALANLPEFMEHPVCLWQRPEPDNQWPDLIGRRVFWQGQPGVVTDFDPRGGRVTILYDVDDIRAADAEGFADDLVSTDNLSRMDALQEDLLSWRIDWFRRLRTQCSACDGRGFVGGAVVASSTCSACSGNGYVEER